jgi:hypothetical protein
MGNWQQAISKTSNFFMEEKYSTNIIEVPELADPFIKIGFLPFAKDDKSLCPLPIVYCLFSAYRIYNTPLPPLLEARAVGVKIVPRSETLRKAAASPIDPPRNRIPPELVTSQVPEHVVVAPRLRFPSMPGQKPGPPTESWAFPAVD